MPGWGLKRAGWRSVGAFWRPRLGWHCWGRSSSSPPPRWGLSAPERAAARPCWQLSDRLSEPSWEPSLEDRFPFSVPLSPPSSSGLWGRPAEQCLASGPTAKRGGRAGREGTPLSGGDWPGLSARSWRALRFWWSHCWPFVCEFSCGANLHVSRIERSRAVFFFSTILSGLRNERAALTSKPRMRWQADDPLHVWSL